MGLRRRKESSTIFTLLAFDDVAGEDTAAFHDTAAETIRNECIVGILENTTQSVSLRAVLGQLVVPA